MSAPLPANGAAARDDWDQHWRDYARAVSENPAERMRVELVLGILDLRHTAARVLDVGSGQGDLIAALVTAHPAVEAVGLELSESGVEISKAKAPDARFLQRDLLEPDTPAEDLRRWATHATCSEVLEHVDNPVTLLRNASAYMAPGCRLAVTVPGGPMSAFDHHIGHRQHFTARRLREVLERAGFEVERVGGAGFPFFNLYRLMIVARGRRLVEDVAQRPDGAASPAALLAMRGFRALFRFNATGWRWGWQIVAQARTPSSPTSEPIVRIQGTRISLLRRAWDRLPSALRRPVIRLMRSERFRTRFLGRLGIRDEDAFLTLSNGGPQAIDLALARLASAGVTGDYYEFGVYRGYTLWYAQQAALRISLESMRFFGFDSFEGLPEVEGADRRAGIFVPGDYRCARADVERRLSERGFDWSRGALIEGFFDRSLTPEAKRAHGMSPAALIVVDCDLYQSTVPVLAFSADLLQDGTIMLFDDWYCFGESPDSGEPRAFHEFLAEHPEWSAVPFATFGAYGRAFVMRRTAGAPAGA